MYQQALQSYGTDFAGRMELWSKTHGGKLPVVNDDAFVLMHEFFSQHPPQGWLVMDPGRSRSWQVKYEPDDLKAFVITNKISKLSEVDGNAPGPLVYGHFVRGGKQIMICYGSFSYLQDL